MRLHNVFVDVNFGSSVIINMSFFLLFMLKYYFFVGTDNIFDISNINCGINSIFKLFLDLKLF